MRDLIARALVGAITTAAFVAGLSAAAGAQEFASGPANNRARLDFEFAGGTGISTLSGEAHSGVQSNYDDLWGDGTLNWINLGMQFPIAERDKVRISLGPVLQFDQATYGGGTDTDAGGVTLLPDDFTTTRIMGGAQLRLAVSKPGSPISFVFGPRLMLGWARHDAVNADLAAPGLGTFARGQFYSETDTFAFDLSVQLGLVIHATEFLDFGINAGLGFSIMGGPDNGSALFNDPDASAIASGYGTIGLSFTFKQPKLGSISTLRRDSRAAPVAYRNYR